MRLQLFELQYDAILLPPMIQQERLFCVSAVPSIRVCLEYLCVYNKFGVKFFITPLSHATDVKSERLFARLDVSHAMQHLRKCSHIHHGAYNPCFWCGRGRLRWFSEVSAGDVAAVEWSVHQEGRSQDNLNEKRNGAGTACFTGLGI